MIEKEINSIIFKNDYPERKSDQMTQQEVEDFFKEVFRMQGEFIGDGDPKTGQEFWREIC